MFNVQSAWNIWTNTNGGKTIPSPTLGEG